MAMNVQRFIDNAIEEIKRDVKGRAIIGLSGGVDSSVCAMLAHRALGDRLVPVYVDSGLMRQFESDRIEQLFQNIGLVRVNAQDRFIDALKAVTDPEKKRMIVERHSSASLRRRPARSEATASSRGRSTRTESNRRAGSRPITMWAGCPAEWNSKA